MTPPERECAVAYLEASRERLLKVARALTSEQLQYKPASDRWSVAEILEHLVFTEQRALSRIQKALLEPATASKSPMDDETLVQVIAGRAVRLSAPEPIRPNGRWPLDRLLPEFEAARSCSIDFAKTTAADLRQHSLDHPFLGPLDCYQWLLAIPAHCERHRLQAEEVLASASFPWAATAHTQVPGYQ